MRPRWPPTPSSAAGRRWLHSCGSGHGASLANARVQLAFDEQRIGSQATITCTRNEPLVLFQHCLLGSRSHSFKPLIRNLDQQLSAIGTTWRIINVDARNHGESPHCTEHSYEAMIDDLHRMMQVNEWHDTPARRVVLIGHSMGARTSMGFALNRHLSSTIAALVSIDAAPATTAIIPLDLFDAMNRIDVSALSAGLQGRSQAESILAQNGVASKAERAFVLANLLPVLNIKHGRTSTRTGSGR